MSPPQAPLAHPPLTGSARLLGTLALSAATFMNVLDSSIANVSLPAIAGDLGVSPVQGTWVITSFAVANAIDKNPSVNPDQLADGGGGVLLGLREHPLGLADVLAADQVHHEAGLLGRAAQVANGGGGNDISHRYFPFALESDLPA